MSEPLDTIASGLQMVSLDDSASDATFYLLTSDAERVAVDTHLLASNSTVFKDLLEIGSAEGGNKTCKVAETVQEIRLLVKTLETSKIDDRSADTLKVLARLGDKYDIRKVVSALQEELVSLLSTSPVLVCAVAEEAGMNSLMELAANHTLDLNLEASIGFRDLSPVAKYRLERYHLAKIEAARCALASLSERKPCNCFQSDYNPRHPFDSYAGILQECLLASMNQLTASTVPHKLLREELNARIGRWPGGKKGCKGCKGCKMRFAKDVAEVKDSWMSVKF